MPTEEAYQAVLAELAKMAEAWRVHRDSMNRAVGILGHELYSLEKRIETLQYWQWARFGVEVGVIIVWELYRNSAFKG